MFTPHEDHVLNSVLMFLVVCADGSIRKTDHRNMWNMDGVQSEYNSVLNRFEPVYTINTTGCSVPKMQENDRTVKEYIHYPQDVEKCTPNHQPLLQSNKTHIWVDTEHFGYYGITQPPKLKCCYRSFHQITSHAIHNFQNEIMYMDCIKFQKYIRASNEFVKVECYYYDNFIYSQFFLFVPKKSFPERQDFYRAMATKTTFNVIIMGLSSISRVNAHRSMPYTMNLLKKLGSIELLGYHAVGSGSLENIMPILTGMTTRELIATCWSNTQPMQDSCPFIWEMFKNVGYFTALVQDTAHSGIFDSNMYGFSGKPADYYVHPFIKESASNDTQKRTSEGNLQHFFNIEDVNPKLDTPKVCIGDRYYFSFILDYIEKLTGILRSSKLFGFFWESSLSHSLNAPIMMDEEYARLLLKFNETEYLNNTILLFLSDEGFPQGGIKSTKQGRLERRLPLLTILLPPAFRERYSTAYENLKINSNRLTTPFDLYETLVDLTELHNIENKEMILRNQSKLVYERGMSLFEPIPEKRTCDSAGIRNTWCTCHQTSEIGIHSNLTRKAVKYIETHLNWLLRYYPQCAKLDVEFVTEAVELWPSFGNENGWREFRFKIIISPGAAEYEALLRREHRSWSLLGPIKRLDITTEPSICSTDDFIKWYCQCTEVYPVTTSRAQYSLAEIEELGNHVA